MRVENCTQVFSHTFATAMHLAARMSVELQPDSLFYLHPQTSDTADLLLFFEKLYDNVNDSSAFPLPGKELLCAATKNNGHIAFWRTSSQDNVL